MGHFYHEILSLSQLVGVLESRFGGAPNVIAVSVHALILLRRRAAGHDILTLGVDLQAPSNGPRVQLKKVARRYRPESVPPGLRTVFIYRLRVFENHIGTKSVGSACE